MGEFSVVEFIDGVEIKDKLKSENNIDNLKQALHLCNFVCCKNSLKSIEQLCNYRYAINNQIKNKKRISKSF